MKATSPSGLGSNNELAAQLERHLLAFRHIAHVGSWEWQLASDAVTWSDELYQIYGLSPQSCPISFELFLSKLHSEDRDRIHQELQAALARGGPFSYRERILRPDGEVRTLDTHGRVETTCDGKSSRVLGTCRDVTDESGLDASHRLYASIIESLPLPLSVWCVEDPTDARSATLVAYNPTAERSAGVSLAHGIGKSAEELFPRAMDTELSELLTQVAASGKPAELPAFRFLSGERQWRTVSMLAFPLPGKCVGLASEDISLQDGARRLLAAERHVLELVASDARLDEVLANIVLAIEEHAPSTIASILLLDEQGTHVVHGAAPHLPDEYSRAVDGQPIGPANGSCGTAAFLRRAVFVSDIETDPLWSAYRHLALRFGLRACSSTPIMTSDERVLGTFALYYRERRTPSREDLELIARATHLAGIAIERRQLDDRTRALSAHLEAAREDERTAVAREIHDDLGQALTALKMDVAWIERRNRQASSLDRESLSQKLRAMSQMTDEIIDRVRRIAAGLRPGVLDDLGLSAAIEWQASEFQQRANTTCVVRSEIEQARFEHKVSTAIFRIFQEALTNVARHAQASRVDVLLSRAQGVLRLQVHDNGRGIGPAKLAHAGSLGLLGMHERARRLGGTFVIRVPPEGGTLLVVEIPLAPEREAAL